MNQGDTYPAPEHGWTCFHCGETFHTVGGARDHFGADPSKTPGCLIRVQYGDERGLQMALREAEATIEKLRTDIENDTTGTTVFYRRLESHLKSHIPFRKCRTLQDVFNVFDSMEGRALAAEEKHDALLKLINTPIIDDFMKAVPMEAAHQQLRWGSEHDAGKNCLDWFWVLGYLGQRIVEYEKAGNREKALHHCITTAALLMNWHRHLLDDSTMRPGIDQPEGIPSD